MVYICIYIYTVLGDPDLVSSSFHKVYILLTVVIMFIVVEVMANLYVLSMSGLNRLAIMSTFIHYIELHHLISLLYISWSCNFALTHTYAHSTFASLCVFPAIPHSHTHTPTYAHSTFASLCVFVPCNSPLIHTHTYAHATFASLCVFVPCNSPLIHAYTHTHTLPLHHCVCLFPAISHSYTHTHTHTHIHTHYLCITVCLFPAIPHSYTHAHIHSRYLCIIVCVSSLQSPTHIHTHTHPHTYAHATFASLCVFVPCNSPLIHTYTHTLTLPLHHCVCLLLAIPTHTHTHTYTHLHTLTEDKGDCRAHGPRSWQNSDCSHRQVEEGREVWSTWGERVCMVESAYDGGCIWLIFKEIVDDKRVRMMEGAYDWF